MYSWPRATAAEELIDQNGDGDEIVDTVGLADIIIVITEIVDDDSEGEESIRTPII